jgi:hypothetical protein
MGWFKVLVDEKKVEAVMVSVGNQGPGLGQA